MRGILIVECKRAIHSIGMIVAVLMGIGCVVYQIIPIINKMCESEKMLSQYDYYISYTRGGFYNYWLPGYLDGSTIYFFYFIGILVALPYGISYYNDKKSGVIKNICNRVNKKKYLNAKFFSVFFSGGIVAVIPLIVDFLIVRLIIPMDNFDIEGTCLNAITEWHVFIVDHPYISMGIFLLMWFIFSGALATISLMVSSFSNNFFSIQLSPFFFMMLLFYLPTFLADGYEKFFPFYFLSLFGKGNPLICMVETLLILIVTYSVFVIGESKKDIL